jgi:hypothetical protein
MRAAFTDPDSGIAVEAYDAVGERFLDSFVSITCQMNREQREWIASLRARGVKAARPDDGWVNRQYSYFRMQYPAFDDAPGFGDWVALGNPRSYRLVRVIAVLQHGSLFPHTRYYFNPTPLAHAL